MSSPRSTAIIILILLIGSISFLCIAGLQHMEPATMQQKQIQRVSGEIVSMPSDTAFILKTEDGEQMYFQCGHTCTASMQHVERHMLDHALTFVYYIQKPDHSLDAITVD